MMAQTVGKTGVDRRMEAENLAGRLPRRAGMIAGFAGALAIMVVVTIMVVASGESLFTAPRVIASAVFGPEVSGMLPVIVGTLIHLLTGTVLGLIFALIMPPIYRVMWMVAGLIYGMVAWFVSAVVVLPVIAPLVMEASSDASVLLIAHMVYGFILGMAGATYGRWWSLPGSD